MKIVREYINEKFTRDSDPIKDMGIGRYERYRPQCIDILRRFLRFYSHSESFQLKKKLLHGKEITFDDLKTIKELGNFLVKEKKMHHTLNLPNINEKFTEEGDPIKDMGIGMMHQIKLWVKELKENYDEKNLLWLCAKHGKEEFVKYLLNKGYDVHAYNDAPLRYASYYGYDKVVKLLLDAGANVHVLNDAALQDASYNGHVDVVKVLLDAGANVHAENNAALQWAKNAGHDNIVKILKDHIAKEKKSKR